MSTNFSYPNVNIASEIYFGKKDIQQIILKKYITYWHNWYKLIILIKRFSLNKARNMQQIWFLTCTQFYLSNIAIKHMEIFGNQYKKLLNSHSTVIHQTITPLIEKEKLYLVNRFWRHHGAWCVLDLEFLTCLFP